MRIAQIAPLAESVPPRGYGGTERVVHWITEELVREGHEVTLFASGDSQTSANLVPVAPKATRLDSCCSEPTFYHALMMEEVLRRADQFDIIHGHVDGLLHPILRRIKTPSVHTLHGRLDIPEVQLVYNEFDEIPLVSISDSQRKPLPQGNWVATVYHGMPNDLFSPGYQPEDYFLFLGRMSPEKAPEDAIAIAKAAGTKLLMAAKIDPKERDYFEQRVRPLLQEGVAEYVGEVADDDKAELLKNARALILPIRWPEPFGLVMIEAMASGTPVIAMKHGSVPELVKDGVNGFACDSIESAIDAARAISNVSRETCRRYFEQHFTSEKMARAYLGVYESLIGQMPEETSLVDFRSFRQRSRKYN